jgi:hypothetical protein
MPSHTELVAGKHDSGASDNPSPLYPFNYKIKLLLLKLYMMKNQFKTDCAPSAIRSSIENAYYYKNSIIQ